MAASVLVPNTHRPLRLGRSGLRLVGRSGPVRRRWITSLMNQTEKIFKTEPLYTRSGWHSRQIVLNRIDEAQMLDKRTLNYIYFGVKAYRKHHREVMSVIIRNTGGESFCPGADFLQLYPDLDLTKPYRARSFFRLVQELAWDLASCTYPPTISIMNGVVGGPGLAFGLNCRYACATPNTVVAVTEALNGFVPYGGSTFRCARLPKKLGYYLALTGAPLSGEDVFFAELASHFAPDHLYDHVILSLENNETKGFESIQVALSEGLDMYGTMRAEDYRAFSLREQADTINRCFSKPSVEEVIRALDEEETDWAAETKAAMLRASPTALKATLKMLQMSERMSIEEVIRMEHRAMRGMMEHSDYKTGLGKVLSGQQADRAGGPSARSGAEEAALAWDPPTLEEVEDADVQRILNPELDEKEDMKMGILVEDVAGGAEPDNTHPDLSHDWLRQTPEEEMEIKKLWENTYTEEYFYTDGFDAVEKGLVMEDQIVPKEAEGVGRRPDYDVGEEEGELGDEADDSR